MINATEKKDTTRIIQINQIKLLITEYYDISAQECQI